MVVRLQGAADEGRAVCWRRNECMVERAKGPGSPGTINDKPLRKRRTIRSVTVTAGKLSYSCSLCGA